MSRELSLVSGSACTRLSEHFEITCMFNAEKIAKARMIM